MKLPDVTDAIIVRFPRNIYLGQPPQKYLDVEKAVLEGIEAGLEAVKPSNFVEDIEVALRKTISKYGYEK